LAALLPIISESGDFKRFPSGESSGFADFLELLFGGGPDSIVDSGTVELVADLDKSLMVHERKSDVGSVGAVDEIDEFSNEYGAMV
jgi:hypothetical protein